MDSTNADGALLMKLIVLTNILLTLASLGMQVFGSKRPQTIGPQPLEVVEGKTYMTRAECDARHLEAKARGEEFRASLAHFQAQREGDLAGVRSELASMRADLARVQAGHEASTQSLNLVSSRLDRLIERGIGPTPAKA
jgi:hypothetical protein